MAFGFDRLKLWTSRLGFKAWECLYLTFASEEFKNDALWNFLEKEVERYPHLRTTKPNGWPRHKKYGITNSRMEDFQKQRSAENLEGLNLPLVLHNIAFNDDEKLKQIFGSMVASIDWFCREMLSKPGARSIIEPLWNAPWDMLRLWGVVSEVLLTQLLIRKGFVIEGFERQRTDSKKTIDIKTSFQGKIVWIDIEANAMKPFEGTAAELRTFVEKRSKDKIRSKFSDLTSAEIGLVASIYRLSNRQNRDRFIADVDVLGPVGGHSPNTAASIYWIIQGRPEGSDEPFGLYLVDQTTNIVPFD